MRRIVFGRVAVAALAGVVACALQASGQTDGEAVPIFGIKIPPGYREWGLISVAHEEGKLNDLRAILGNDVAIKAARKGTLPYPDGSIVARLAWNYDPLAESEKAFGSPQSFVAGPPKNGVQFMIKDSSKFASTGGWGTLSSTTANLPERRCTMPALPAMRSSRSATSSSTVMRREDRPEHRNIQR
jgi:hypothetical protein